MKPVKETRVIVRAVQLDEHDGIRTLKGSAVVYNSPSFEMPGKRADFVETIRPGAFGELDGQDIVAYLNHNRDKFLGRTSNGTLRLFDTDTSLDFEVDLPDTSAGDEAYQHVVRRDIVGVSFTANVLDEQWNDDATRCELVNLQLTEISPVFDPAYGDTNIALRHLERAKDRPKPRYRRLEYAQLLISLDEND